MDELSRLRDDISSSIIEKKEAILKDAISHVLGRDDWEAEELAGRGQFLSLGNKETFVFDNVPMVEFEKVSFDSILNKISLSVRYKKLYD